MSAVEAPRSRRGLVAFFQVLGAKRVLEGGCREHFKHTIAHVQEEIVGSAEPAPLAKAFRGSVVLVKEFGASDGAAEELLQWTAFVRHAAHLHRHLFNHGYPARCSIGFGDVLQEHPEAASELVLGAYDLTRQQEWCGGVLTPEAEQELWDLAGHEDPHGAGAIQDLLVRYPVPLKGHRNKMLALNWGREDAARIFTPLDGSVREAVMRAFVRNGKVLDEAAVKKAGNTEAFLWHCRENIGHL